MPNRTGIATGGEIEKRPPGNRISSFIQRLEFILMFK
jgi:hypothetical protein